MQREMADSEFALRLTADALEHCNSPSCGCCGHQGDRQRGAALKCLAGKPPKERQLMHA
jgi:hypothetical protein